MLKWMKVRRLESKLTEIGQSWDREHHELVDAMAVVDGVVHGAHFKFDGAALIETRTQTHVNFASVPIHIGGVRLRVGQARPVSREVMTVIDMGEFTVNDDRATFIGAKHQRTWEYKKIVGYNTEADSEVLIAVTNRQKMSGVRYRKGSDFMVDAALNAAVERHRGNEAAVTDWANTTRADLQARLDRGQAEVNSLGSEKATELAGLVGEEEAATFVATLPGISLTPARPTHEPPKANWPPPAAWPPPAVGSAPSDG